MNQPAIAARETPLPGAAAGCARDDAHCLAAFIQDRRAGERAGEACARGRGDAARCRMIKMKLRRRVWGGRERWTRLRAAPSETGAGKERKAPSRVQLDHLC
jgi:hypothetical protein